MDEERKINLNIVSEAILSNLIERVLGMKEDAAGLLARAILDWRQLGESEAKGFFR